MVAEFGIGPNLDKEKDVFSDRSNDSGKRYCWGIYASGGRSASSDQHILWGGATWIQRLSEGISMTDREIRLGSLVAGAVYIALGTVCILAALTGLASVIPAMLSGLLFLVGSGFLLYLSYLYLITEG